MKVKNFFQLSCIVLVGILSTAFTRSSPVVEGIPSEIVKANFAEFLSHFEKVELPYSMNLNDFKQYEYYTENNQGKKSKKIQKLSSKKGKVSHAKSPIFSEFLPKNNRRMFSRGGGPRNYPVARFYPNEKMVAVVYSTSQNFIGDLYQTYNLAVYSLKGDLLFPKSNTLSTKTTSETTLLQQTTSVESLASPLFNIGSSSHEQTITFRVDEKGNIWKNTYENVWKKDVKKKGYRRNQLIDFKIKDTQVFQLNEKGEVEKLKATLSDERASLD